MNIPAPERVTVRTTYPDGATSEHVLVTSLPSAIDWYQHPAWDSAPMSACPGLDSLPADFDLGGEG